MAILLSELHGVGKALAQKLQGLGLRTVDDLIQNVPRRYEDYSRIMAINALKPGIVTVQAQIKQAKGKYLRRGLHLTEAVASDATGSVRLVWFNQPYRAASFKSGEQYFIAGEFGLNYRHLSIMNPSVELVSEFPVNTARIVPIYRETKGITSKQIRRIVREVLPYIRTMPEMLPTWVIKEYDLLPYAKAIEGLHFPSDTLGLEAAQKRLGFQEVFELVLASLLMKQEVMTEPATIVPFNEQLAREFVSNLPFQLTDAQRKVVWQIYQDIQESHPMNRLVEGDVGSGKTVVATMAALAVAEEGMQTAFMAPTELLARQHADTIHKLLEPLRLQEGIVLLVGSMRAAEKKRAYEAIKSGRAKIVIGTHALIQEKLDMHKLALIVIDEQHRFGVEQRKKLMAKAGKMPHVLSLTATPIPRSLALTLYGELDISLLDAKPEGRQEVKTVICSPNSRAQLYKTIEAELETGRQMFVVCPLISDSDTTSARSVEEVYEEMTAIFRTRKIGLVHGKLKAEEKNQVMADFVKGDIDILVSTTVIEVGVDIPNASIMLIESADRFGLAQIHQLRGRVGRGGHKGYCYLMTTDSSAPSKRLRALETSNDGFKLAELDLRLRGPGAIYGTMQHGALDLRIANLTDTKLLLTARSAAEEFMKRDEKLLKYPVLQKRILHLQKVTKLN